MRDQLLQLLLRAALQQGLHFGQRHVAQPGHRKGRQPGLARSELGLQRVPLRGAQGLCFCAQQGDHGLAVKSLHGLGPGRVQALRQRQIAAGHDGRQRQRGSTAAAEQVLPQRRIAFDTGAQRRQRLGVECGQARARKEILDLCLHRIQGLGRGHGLLALREHAAVFLRLVMPGLDGAHIGKESVERVEAHAGLAVTAFGTAVQRHDAADQGRQRGLVR
ncbi:hypothetical protein D3C78_1190840 [compost metagenome]